MGLRKKIPLAFVTLNHLLPGRGGQTLGYWFWREHSDLGPHSAFHCLGVLSVTPSGM